MFVSLYNAKYTRTLLGAVGFMVMALNAMAQTATTNPKTFTAPPERQNWVMLTASSPWIYEFDYRSIVWVDSIHFMVKVREVPNKRLYYQVKVDKMWEQRSIIGYSDSLRRQPIFTYDGYENYGYTIVEEKFNILTNQYIVVKATDFDVNGEYLGQWDQYLVGQDVDITEDHAAESVLVKVVAPLVPFRH
jgi:hypothetical protein